MTALLIVMGVLQVMAQRPIRRVRLVLADLRASRDDGSVTLEKVVITAILVAGALAVASILVKLATDRANSIETEP